MTFSLLFECMKIWADKTLARGCLLQEVRWRFYVCIWEKEYDDIKWYSIVCASLDWKAIRTVKDSDIKHIMWHPITWWRLYYLRYKNKEKQYPMVNWRKLSDYVFNNDIEIYNQTILEWSEEFWNNYLLPFLQSLKTWVQ